MGHRPLQQDPGESHVLAQRQARRLTTELGDGFTSATVEVNGTSLHYVRGGSGPAVILIHGFPQDWLEFHAIMPRLARRFTVVAVDLRGVGGSTPTDDGYDAANLARDVFELASAVALEQVYVVGHDLGGQVAYAFARQFPEITRGTIILDSPIPAIEGLEELVGDPRMWHGVFHQIPGLPEALVAGRQEIYFRHFFEIGTLGGRGVSDADLAHYAEAYAAPAQLRAGLEMYRAFAVNLEFNAAHLGSNDVPLLLAAGEGSPFAKLLPTMAADLRSKGFPEVETTLIPDSVHYILEDQPEAVADLIERHAAAGPRRA